MKFKLRMTHVHEVIDLSPHMRRIVLAGDDLKDFPANHEGAHVKIVLPKTGESKPNLSFSFGMKKSMRSYTIGSFDDVQKLLTIDFAVNGHQGIAADWALKAKKGDYLGIGGPGKTKHTDYFADWQLLVADLTGLPALAATLEKMPKEAVGYAIAQVPSLEDQQKINVPKGIHLKWIVNNTPSNLTLLDEVKSLEWLAGNPAIFIAAEASLVKNIRRYVTKMPEYSKQRLYASGYWKL